MLTEVSNSPKYCCFSNQNLKKTLIAIATIAAIVGAIFLRIDFQHISASRIGFPLLITATIVLGLPVFYAVLKLLCHTETTNPLKNITLTKEDFDNFQQFQLQGENNSESAHANGVKFYYGNCDEVQDLGWGCAWRSIEICASPYNIQYDFKGLYQQYSRCKDISRSEWAEPGYGKRFFDDHNIPSKLYLYNRPIGSDKTPTDACKCFTSFKEFETAMFRHFQKNQTPIMVDDGYTAFTIIGIKRSETGKVILWIADPHKTTKNAGLYYLVLNQQGQKVLSTGIDNGRNGLSTAQNINPAKGWMLLFPQKI